MLEIIFLLVLALIWIIFATIQDLRTKEIANWLNFSFVALGPILPVSNNFFPNLENFFLFLLIFFLVGAVYSIITGFALCFKHYSRFRKELKKQFKGKKKLVILATFFAVIIGLSTLFTNYFLLYLAVLIFLLPYLYLYAKAADEAIMIKIIDSKNLREGDWLYKDIKIKGKTIRATWNGLSRKEISLLRKSKKKVLIREGVAFSPVFLISFLVFFYLWIIGLRYSFW